MNLTIQDKRFRSEQLLEELIQVILLSSTHSEMNYNFYVECLDLLMILFSGQMMQCCSFPSSFPSCTQSASPTSPATPKTPTQDSNLFLKLLLDNLTHFSRGLIARLLMNFLEQQSSPRDSSSNYYLDIVFKYILGVFSSAYNFFFTPMDQLTTLSDKSTLLILLLCNQHSPGMMNGFRTILSDLVDLQGRFLIYFARKSNSK